MSRALTPPCADVPGHRSAWHCRVRSARQEKPAQHHGDKDRTTPGRDRSVGEARLRHRLRPGPATGDDVGTNWAEISSPLFMDAGADLMLLHPDGSEEVLVAGGKGSVADPMVSFDGEWVYYSLFHDLEGATITDAAPAGADIYKIHVKTRKIVRLTHQQFTPNTGAGNWSRTSARPSPGKNFIAYGVFNTGPCPLPGGKVVFTSNRNAFRPPKRLPHTMQLFVMDDDGATSSASAT